MMNTILRIVKVTVTISNLWWLLRTNCRYCIHRSGTYNIHVEYCTCRKKDGCNSASGAEVNYVGSCFQKAKGGSLVFYQTKGTF